MINQRGIVYTFYSFKGGVGRSMALANVAALLAKAGNRVLIIDWDLEAPGLEKYFENKPSSLSESRRNVRGIVDLVSDYSSEYGENNRSNWRECLLYAYPFKEGKPISILTAGRDDEKYVSKLQSINWEFLFNERSFGSYLEALREEWVNEYDFILVDSRTGITDIGGICTIHLPDVLVMLFTANEQSVSGVLEIYKRVAEKFKSLPLDRSKLLAVPIPSRFDNITEHKLATQWKNIFADRLSDVYREWLPDKTSPSDILEKLFIPHVPYWSFGEGLPVVSEGTSDPRSLGFAYNLLALLLANRVQWNNVVSGDLYLSNELGPAKINELADSTFRHLNEYEKREIKEVLLRLVNPINNTRIIIKEKDLNNYSYNLIEAFIRNGILFRSRDSLTNEFTLEISHDSILLYWSELQNWIKENKSFLLWRQELSSKSIAWEENGFKKELLLSGTELKNATKLYELRQDQFNKRETYFLKRSWANERRERLLKLVPTISIIIAIFTFTISLYTQNIQRSKDQNLLQQQLRAQDSLNKALQNDNRDLFLKYQLTIDSLTFLIKKGREN